MVESYHNGTPGEPRRRPSKKDYLRNFGNSSEPPIGIYMILENKKGRTKALGSKSSRNSYFKRSRLILRPLALRHLILRAFWPILQKLCQNWLLSHFNKFCGCFVFALMCVFDGSCVSPLMLLFVASFCQTWGMKTPLGWRLLGGSQMSWDRGRQSEVRFARLRV